MLRRVPAEDRWRFMATCRRQAQPKDEEAAATTQLKSCRRSSERAEDVADAAALKAAAGEAMRARLLPR